MSLEKSVLDFVKMRDVLSKEYGLHLIDSKSLELGSANCFRIHCEEGVFFFKEYQSDFKAENVNREAGIVEYLSSGKFPVAGFIKTLSGQNCIVYEGHVISVQEYIEGQAYLNDLPYSLLKESAKYLGIMHSLLKDYPMEESMNYEWASGFSADAVSKKFNALLASLDEDKSDPNYEKIREDLIFKKKLMDSIDAWKEYFKDVTYTATHGDYTACQLICDGDTIKAVIDFSSAACIPAVWEIMRSYIQSGGVSRTGTDFDIEDFALYVNEYRKYAPLTQRDLEAMPYIYLFQLAQSSYGYKEYLVTKSENREALLDFAFWRTDICREIYRKAKAISELIGSRRHGLKTLIFNGSPRVAGDTVSLINRLTELLDGEYKVVDAYRSNISPCLDCRYCWKNPGCAIKDEMQDVYRYIEDCDNIVIASPIYFSELTGKMLDVGSRLQTYFCGRFFRKEAVSIKPKKGAVILVGGGDGRIEKPYETACTLLHHVNCRNIHEVVCSFNTNVVPAIEDKEAVEGIERIAKFLNAEE